MAMKISDDLQAVTNQQSPQSNCGSATSRGSRCLKAFEEVLASTAAPARDLGNGKRGLREWELGLGDCARVGDAGRSRIQEAVDKDEV
jgi:hypothetical protein